jgi:crotonobetaine/carnitine-CoA ligase
LSSHTAEPEQAHPDGWFRTGDAFRRNEWGEYQLIDRLKDYIRHRGHNLSSIELERELLAHPLIAECAFVGVPSDLADTEVVGDEDVKAVVVLENGATMTAIDVVDFLEPRLPRYMLPRYVDFVDALPRTATLKTRKTELRNASRGTDVWQLSS